jgi:hypothetical protein
MPIPSPIACGRWILSVGLLFALQQPAQAVPSYARQTNSECAACHIGAFGPHLTPYGIRFKLGGYVDSDGQGTKVPLSFSTQLTATKTGDGNPALHGKSDVRLTNVDIYVAGKLFDNVGTYTRVAHVENAAGTDYTQLDDFDLRFAKEAKFGERSVVWGVTLNNHPGVQDPIDVMPAWGFGAAGPGRDFVQRTRTGTLMNKYQGGLAHRVLGLSGYAFVDDHWYGELGTYKTLSPSVQNKLGLPEYAPGADVGDPGRLSNTLYWRGAWMHDLKTHFYSVGLFGLTTQLQSDRTGPTDRVQDVGIDASYMYLGNRDHMVQMRASHIVERRRYGTRPTLSFFPPAFGGPTGQATGSVRESTISGTYAFHNTVGITAARTWAKTNEDHARFVTAHGTGDAYFNFIGAYWNVWGKEGDPVPVGVNLQVGAAFIHFDRFNGTTTNIFGPGSGVRAKDLDSTLFYVRLVL